MKQAGGLVLDCLLTSPRYWFEKLCRAVKITRVGQGSTNFILYPSQSQLKQGPTNFLTVQLAGFYYLTWGLTTETQSQETLSIG